MPVILLILLVTALVAALACSLRHAQQRQPVRLFGHKLRSRTADFHPEG